MTTLSVTLTIVIYIIAHSEAMQVDWNIYCGNDDHILCSYANKEEHNCNGKNVKLINVTETEKNAILQRFNTFRSKLANNVAVLKNDDHLGICSKMQELKWDPFLEEMAKARCMRCSVDYYDKPAFILLNSFGPGEMIASPSHTDVDMNADNILEVVDKIWIDHSKHFDVREGDCEFGRLPFEEYQKKRYGQNEIIYSLIQVFKDDHYMIGCASSHYMEGEESIYLYACFTGATTAGKTERVIIHVGVPASECDVRSNQYQGLCSSEDNDKFPSVYDKEYQYFPPTSSANNSDDSGISTNGSSFSGNSETSTTDLNYSEESTIFTPPGNFSKNNDTASGTLSVFYAKWNYWNVICTCVAVVKYAVPFFAN